MTTPDLAAAEQALIADLTAIFGTLTAGKAVAFFPGLPVDDQIVQKGVVNTLRLAQWLTTFDTPMVLVPGQAQNTAPPGGQSATALYSTIIHSAAPLDPTSQAGRQVVQRLAADLTLVDQVSPAAPLGSDPTDWPLPGNASWQTASTAHTQAAPDLSDPANTTVTLPNLGSDDPSAPQEFTLTAWLKAVGDSVRAGDPLFEAETGKADTEVPSPATGTLLRIAVPEGATVRPGDTLGVIGPGQPPPQAVVAYQYTLVSLTRLASGTPWWDDILLTDPDWYVPGRAAGTLLPAPGGGAVNALPYALLVVRDVVVNSPGQPPSDTETLGPVLVSPDAGTTPTPTPTPAGAAPPLGRSGMQAVGLVANALPSLPPAGDPALTAATPPAFQPFPGADFFTAGRRSPVVAAMHARLVAVGCGRYTTTTGQDVWGDGDTASYQAWQVHLGFSGTDADGRPGQSSWDALQVPFVTATP
ncbi:peptidoglycan-binding protein [Kitasatospora sp. NPDC101183]|uniref:peptidoglycan-binding protein n=1 Tax=Kitasatospora sp. NPDC101183 TaxID=3364100 RepID=UPI00381B976B